MKVMAAIQVALPALLRRRWPHTRRRRRRSSPSHDRVIEIRDKIPSSLLDLLREGHLGVIDFGIVKDGYQWSKYGQKVIRGNPSPRAYFKCAFAPTCLVKKKISFQWELVESKRNWNSIAT